MRRAEYNVTGRTQTNDTKCFNTEDGHGHRAKRQGAKRVRQKMDQKLRNWSNEYENDDNDELFEET